MVELIRKHKPFLYMLRFAGAKKQPRIDILKELTEPEVKVILELAANSLHGVIPLTRPQKKILRKIKSFILSLLSIDISLQSKKSLIIKHHLETFQLISTIFDTLRKLVWHQG